jgi:hypothetical protein
MKCIEYKSLKKYRSLKNANIYLVFVNKMNDMNNNLYLCGGFGYFMIGIIG